MNPFVWRFMGGAATAYAIDRMIPGYWKWAAQGANVALWGANTRRGRAYAAVGRGVSKAARPGIFAGKWIADKTAKKVLPGIVYRGGTVLLPIAGPAVPIITTYMLVHEATGLALEYVGEKTGIEFTTEPHAPHWTWY